MPENEIGFYRVPQICEKLCISKSTWWLWVKNGKAPQGIKMSPGITVWKKTIIHEFMKTAHSEVNQEKRIVNTKTRDDEYSYIEDLAKRATQGDWMAVGRQIENVRDDLPDICFCDLTDDAKQDAINAEFIAAVQPKVALELIRKLRWYEKNYPA